VITDPIEQVPDASAAGTARKTVRVMSTRSHAKCSIMGIIAVPDTAEPMSALNGTTY
jgi:hypothetical protein